MPFALVGGTAIGTGRGEQVTPLMTVGEYWWVVLEAETGLSTPAVYGAFDALHTERHDEAPGAPEIPDELLLALRGHDVAELGAALSNDLQAAALTLRPELGDVLERGLRESAFGAVLSGSGPSCLFLCEGRSHAVRVAEGLAAHGLGPLSYAPGPVHGARVVSRTGGLRWRRRTWSAWSGCTSPTACGRCWPTSASGSAPASASGWSAATGTARPRCCAWWRASRSPTRGGSRATADCTWAS